MGISTLPRPLRIALLADHLVTVGGAEQVFHYMIQEFPEADIFALAYDPEATLPEFRKYKIHTHWLGRFIKSHSLFKILFPVATILMEHWSLGRYDVILSSSATSAKYLKRHRGARHICYCYFPTRAIWDMRGYFQQKRGSLFIWVFKFLLPFLKIRDRASAARVDKFIAISRTTQHAISKIYGRSSEVLFSPIVVERFRDGMKQDKKDYFLLVSRLEPWKRVDFAIEAFNRLGLPLHIVGQGPDEGRLRAMAKPNITFLGLCELEKLVRRYGEARAVIFTPALEYGLVPLEAVAAGTPVIALGHGGVRETMIDINEGDREGGTAIFFSEQTPEALIEAVQSFRDEYFDREKLSNYAETFAVPEFRRRLREIVEQSLSDAP
jgi:glycosyltransferase involved in cell wall biosynthesis